MVPPRIRARSPAAEPDRESNEILHKVTLSKGFWIAETEFTQGQWKALTKKNPSQFLRFGSVAPVDSVSWEAVDKLLTEINESGHLPENLVAVSTTEAQWEYACRAGIKTAYHFGALPYDRAGKYQRRS